MRFIGYILSISLFICNFGLAAIILTSPNGGEVWRNGTQQNITWINSIGNVTAEYTTNNGVNWINIGTSNTGSFLWTVPNVSAPSARVRVTDQIFSRDTSNASFRIINYSFTNSPIKILPIGNSITFDSFGAEFRFAQNKISYRAFLWDSLRSNNYKIDFIGHKLGGYYQFPDPENNGVPSIRDDQMYNLLATGLDPVNNIQITPGNYLDVYTPNVIILHIGTNGITDPGGTDATDVANILDLIKNYNPNIWVLVSMIIDRVPNIPQVTTFNNNIRNLVQSRITNGDNLFLLDMRSALTYVIDNTPPYTSGDMYDDSHPNDSGKVKMANVCYQTLKLLLPSSSPQAPQFTSIPETKAYLGLPYKYMAYATGVSVPNYLLDGPLPPGMTTSSINTKTGIIDWLPNSLGTYPLTIKATNPTGSVFQNFNITVQSPPDLTDNMISYWKLDETDSAKYYEDLTGINNANPLNIPSSNSGIVGRALNFNGLNGLDVFDDSSLYFYPGESFTIELWMKTLNSGQQYLLGKRGGPTYFLLEQNSFNQAKFTIQDSIEGITTVTGSGLNDGNWHHVTAVVDRPGNSLRIYVDGILSSAPKTFHSSGFFSYAPLTIGYFKNSFFYKGSLDEIAIYNRPLQSSEIIRHYISGLAREGYTKNFVLVKAKAFLQGPFNSTTGLMDTTLKINNFIPKNTQPYSNGPWNYEGLERVIFYPDSVVDWVLVELRDATNPATVVGRRAAFIKKNGNLVEIDPLKTGYTDIIFPDVSPGNYYIVIKHRNHLAIMSSTTIALSTTSSFYDFTTSQSKAYTTGPNPMVNLSAGKFGMIAGDCDGNGFIDIDDFTGIDNGKFQSGYKNSDSNMSGIIDVDDFTFPDNNRFNGTQVPQ